MNKAATITKEPAAIRRRKFWAAIRKDKLLYLLVIPGVLYFILFHYVPMSGLYIAFTKYNVYKGIAASPFIGFDSACLCLPVCDCA